MGKTVFWFHAFQVLHFLDSRSRVSSSYGLCIVFFWIGTFTTILWYTDVHACTPYGKAGTQRTDLLYLLENLWHHVRMKLAYFRGARFGTFSNKKMDDFQCKSPLKDCFFDGWISRSLVPCFVADRGPFGFRCTWRISYPNDPTVKWLHTVAWLLRTSIGVSLTISLQVGKFVLTTT